MWNFSHQSSRKLTADVVAVATFALSSFWKKEGNIKTMKDSRQTFKRNVLIWIHTSNGGAEYLPDNKPCANFVLE